MSHMAAAQKIFMFVFCSHSSMELNIPLGPVETRKLLLHSYIITYRLFALTKTDAENCRSIVAGLLFVFVVNGAGARRATYLCLDSTKNVDKTGI